MKRIFFKILGPLELNIKLGCRDSFFDIQKQFFNWLRK